MKFEEKNMNLSNLLPNFTLFTLFIKKPITLITIVPVAVSVKAIDLYAACTMLAVLFVCDFITGIGASYFKWKEKEVKEDKFFFGKGEGFSSDKFKKMFVKGIVYLAFPYFLIKFQAAFKIRTFMIESISDAELDLVTLIILLFCVNELFSIFRENLPKCGFDIVEKFKKLIGLYKEIKNETNG